MRKNSRRALAALAVLVLAAGMLAAASAATLAEDFSQLALAGDVGAAVEKWEDLQDQVAKEEENAWKDIDKAVDKNDRTLWNEAMAELSALSEYSVIGEEETDSLLAAIVNSGSEEANTWAVWLDENSPWYSPRLTVGVDASGEGWRRAWSRSVSAAPGAEVVLPEASDLSANTSRAGVLTGWGIVPGEVTYEPGETITMPLTDQILYAVFESAVSFTDGATDFESVVSDVAEGETIQVPAAPEREGAVFEGWYDSGSGQYIAPGETEYVVKGNGASFTALWNEISATELSTAPWNTDAVPAATQVPLTFTIANTGTEAQAYLSIEVSTDSEYATLSSTRGSLRRLAPGSEVTMKGTQLVLSPSTPSGTEIPVTVTVTDGDGTAFATTFTLTSR